MPDTPYRFPPPAPAGSRVHVIAPSGLVDAARFARGVMTLAQLGYEVDYEDAVIAASGRYTAGSDAERTAAVNAAVADPDASIVWAARGGYGATRVLPGLDLTPLEHHPKWLVGFSDVTALHVAWQQAGWGSLHGPVVSNVHRWTEPARAQLLAWLGGGTTGRLEGRLLAGSPPSEGPLIGGNLSLLTSLVGTPYLPRLAGAIVLLEDLNEEPYRLDRYLTQLLQSGVLDDVRGFVLGQWTRCGDSVDDALETLVERLADLGVPILGHVAVGHEHTSWPVPLGARARVEGTVGGDGGLVVDLPPVS
jgi:muramoyltetrapeptide carboxypeptidase